MLLRGKDETLGLTVTKRIILALEAGVGAGDGVVMDAAGHGIAELHARAVAHGAERRVRLAVVVLAAVGPVGHGEGMIRGTVLRS